MGTNVLRRKLEKLNKKKEELKAKALASDNADEIRSINEQLEDIAAEIADINEEFEETRSAVPTNAQIVNGSITAAFAQNPVPTAARSLVTENPYGSMEYRTAFWAFATKGTPIPG